MKTVIMVSIIIFTSIWIYSMGCRHERERIRNMERRTERQGRFFLCGRYYTGMKPELKCNIYALRGPDSYHLFNVNHN